MIYTDLQNLHVILQLVGPGNIAQVIHEAVTLTTANEVGTADESGASSWDQSEIDYHWWYPRPILYKADDMKKTNKSEEMEKDGESKYQQKLTLVL